MTRETLAWVTTWTVIAGGAAIARAQADQTVIDSDLTPETRAALVEEFAGGDPYNGEGEHWFDAFDRIEARAHEAIAKARAEIAVLAGAR